MKLAQYTLQKEITNKDGTSTTNIIVVQAMPPIAPYSFYENVNAEIKAFLNKHQDGYVKYEGMVINQDLTDEEKNTVKQKMDLFINYMFNTNCITECGGFTTYLKNNIHKGETMINGDSEPHLVGLPKNRLERLDMNIDVLLRQMELKAKIVGLDFEKHAQDEKPTTNTPTPNGLIKKLSRVINLGMYNMFLIYSRWQAEKHLKELKSSTTLDFPKTNLMPETDGIVKQKLRNIAISTLVADRNQFIINQISNCNHCFLTYNIVNASVHTIGLVPALITTNGFKLIDVKYISD